MESIEELEKCEKDLYIIVEELRIANSYYDRAIFLAKKNKTEDIENKIESIKDEISSMLKVCEATIQQIIKDKERLIIEKSERE